MRASTFSCKLALAALALSSFACAGSSGVTWTGASTDPGVINITPMVFAEGSGVTDAVRAECGLERGIPEKIARHTPVPLVLTDQTNGARTLSLVTTYILAPGGGGFSGPKSLTLQGQLSEGGGVVASFEVRRTTTRGGGTCDMLNIINDAIGKDISGWLAAPSVDARLGEAK